MIKLSIDLLFPSVFCQETKKYSRYKQVKKSEKDLLEKMISRSTKNYS